MEFIFGVSNNQIVSVNYLPKKMRDVYINLQFSISINDILTYLLGFCCFSAMIKFLNLCRINQRLCLFSQTLGYAKKRINFICNDIFSFILSFLCLFYLLFVSKMMSRLSLLGASELVGTDAILGPVAFALFILINYCFFYLFEYVSFDN